MPSSMQFNMIWTMPAAFHKRNDCSRPTDFQRAGEQAEPAVIQMISKLHEMAENLEAMNMDNPITLRLQLEIEELAEKFQALIDGNMVEYLDGTCDQLYVLGGTLATFFAGDRPIADAFEECFVEVHHRNMQKQNRDGKNRVRDKGDDWISPAVKIEKILTDRRMLEVTEEETTEEA